MVNSIVTLQLFDSLGKVIATCFSFELIYLSLHADLIVPSSKTLVTHLQTFHWKGLHK